MANARVQLFRGDEAPSFDDFESKALERDGLVVWPAQDAREEREIQRTSCDEERRRPRIEARVPSRSLRGDANERPDDAVHSLGHGLRHRVDVPERFGDSQAREGLPRRPERRSVPGCPHAAE
jgi:hypothetical protein